LGVRKSFRLVKKLSEELLAWLIATCVEQVANDLHIFQLTPLPPHHLLHHYNRDWFTFLVPAYPDCPGKEAVCLTKVLYNYYNIQASIAIRVIVA